MKIYIQLIIFFIVLDFLVSVKGRLNYFQTSKIITQNRVMHLNELSKKDRLNYELIGNLGKGVKSQCINNEVFKVNILLRNNSKDTLKYIDWTCSSEIWNIDNIHLNIFAPYELENCGGCDHNFISIYTIPPYKNRNLYVFVNKKVISKQISKFKIGMIIQRVLKEKDFNSYADYFFGTKHNLRDQKMNIIWSNSIELP